MQTIVSIPHNEYPAAVRNHVEEKLQHLLRYYERIVSLRAVLSRQGEKHCVELVATVGHGVTLVVESREASLETSLSDSIERMRRVLTRHKTKLADKHRRGGRVGH